MGGVNFTPSATGSSEKGPLVELPKERGGRWGRETIGGQGSGPRGPPRSGAEASLPQPEGPVMVGCMNSSARTPREAAGGSCSVERHFGGSCRCPVE